MMARMGVRNSASSALRYGRPRLHRPAASIVDLGTGDVKRPRHGAHREPSGGIAPGQQGRCPFSGASDVARLFQDLVLHRLASSSRSRSRTRFSRSRTLDVPTTSSSAWTAACPPSSIRRFQAKSCDGETPACRATKDMLIPGCIASSTRRTFSAVDHRRRRCTEVITSTRENGPSGAFDIVVLIGGCLCLIGYTTWLLKNGVRSSPILFQPFIPCASSG